MRGKYIKISRYHPPLMPQALRREDNMDCEIVGEHTDRFGKKWLHVTWRDAVFADLGIYATSYSVNWGWKRETRPIVVWVSPADNVYVLNSTNTDLSEEIRRSVKSRIGEIRASLNE